MSYLELRRLRTKFRDKKDSLLEQARFAADDSDWQGYTLAMGRLHIKNKDRPIQLHYDLNINGKQANVYKVIMMVS